MAGKPWTREEALVAFNVYCRLPFGKLHGRNPEIQRIAALLKRSPNSLAMKCCNFASLDPSQRERGITGLQKVAQIDRDIWNEFASDAERIGFESEQAVTRLVGSLVDEASTQSGSAFVDERAFATTARWEDMAGLDRESLVRVRVNQRFFRAMILSSYESACAVCGLPIPALLVASHIVPWATDNTLRMNPCNGICLCALHDRAFDTGVMLINSDYTIRFNPKNITFRAVPSVKEFLLDFDGQLIRLPQRWHPNAILLERRMQSVVRAPN
jgi:putative restriction endonuclease